MSLEVEGNDGKILQWGDGIPCPKCRSVNWPHHGLFVSHFESGSSRCRRCEEPFDLWQEALYSLKNWPVSWFAFRLLGAVINRFEVELEANKTVPVEFTEIPEGAEIVNVKVMTLGPHDGPAVLPALPLNGEIHWDPFPRHLRLYGMAHGNATPASKVWIAVTWIPPEHELSVHHLVAAAKQFVAGRFSALIIPANVAVEAALTPAMDQWIRTYCDPDETREFLSLKGATFVHQLKVLTKVGARALGIQEIPSPVLIHLTKLLQYRNDLGHKGTLSHPKRKPPDRDRAADFLVAATFGYHYARYFQDAVK